MEKDHKIISNKLPLFGILFLVVIIVGFATFSDSKIKYAEDIETAWQNTLKNENSIRPERVFEILNTPDSAYYRFIDLRNPVDYMNNHIEGAVNIPLHQILDDEHKSVFNQDKRINVIYGNSHEEVCAAVEILKQIGYKNNLIMLGGLKHFTENVLEEYKPHNSNYRNEKPAYDFKTIMSRRVSSSAQAKESEVETNVPVIKKKKAAVEEEGGC